MVEASQTGEVLCPNCQTPVTIPDPEYPTGPQPDDWMRRDPTVTETDVLPAQQSTTADQFPASRPKAPAVSQVRQPKPETRRKNHTTVAVPEAIVGWILIGLLAVFVIIVLVLM